MNSRRVSLAALLLGLLALPPTALLSQRNQSESRRQRGAFGGGSGGGISGAASTATDPGPRPGPAGAGGFFPTLDATGQTAFANGISQFTEDQPVPDTSPGNGGLGPGYNGTSCANCHAQPATLGSSPASFSPQKFPQVSIFLLSNNPPSAQCESTTQSVPQGVVFQCPVTRNPQIDMASEDGATNAVPSFITPNGPVREARFVKKADGTPDGGVHNLFSIAGRADAQQSLDTGGPCNLPQPNFAAQLAANNVIFRIPTPLFGLGLVENTPDFMLESNLQLTASQRSQMGIGGRFNRVNTSNGVGEQFNTSGNDGTIMKFGWKAQNKSLTIFAGEAYNVEIGVSNDVMPNERNLVQGCVFNPTPEDTHSAASESDVDTFVDAMRFAAPPTPVAPTSDTQAGHDAFVRVGCALCHSETLKTSPSFFTVLSNVVYHPFSDFAVHHMGTNLADGVTQGMAGPDEFRTAPLWGIGQRLFFLHDGRTSDLLNSIEQHSSPGSESNRSVQQFNALSPAQQQSVLDFLRSL